MKKKGGIVYSTNLNLKLNSYQTDIELDCDEVNQLTLSICFEKKGRGGKGVTIIKGLQKNTNQIKQLSQEIKSKLGVGGSVKNNEIIIQGRLQEKIITILNAKGFKSKKVGG